jgi:hypothetical protein
MLSPEARELQQRHGHPSQSHPATVTQIVDVTTVKHATTVKHITTVKQDSYLQSAVHQTNYKVKLLVFQHGLVPDHML